jgi:hypothetical protein
LTRSSEQISWLPLIDHAVTTSLQLLNHQPHLILNIIRWLKHGIKMSPISNLLTLFIIWFHDGLLGWRVGDRTVAGAAPSPYLLRPVSRPLLMCLCPFLRKPALRIPCTNDTRL